MSSLFPLPCGDGLGKRPSAHAVSKTVALVVLAVASLGCLQGLRWMARGYGGVDAAIEASQANAIYTPAEVQFLGRNYRQRILQAQLRDKDLEVSFLRNQLESAMMASRVKDDSLRHSEKMIRDLKEREETAKLGRSKAQLALAEKAQALQSCQYQTRTLLDEVTTCEKTLRRL